MKKQGQKTRVELAKRNIAHNDSSRSGDLLVRLHWQANCTEQTLDNPGAFTFYNINSLVD